MPLPLGSKQNPSLTEAPSVTLINSLASEDPKRQSLTKRRAKIWSAHPSQDGSTSPRKQQTIKAWASPGLPNPRVLIPLKDSRDEIHGAQVTQNSGTHHSSLLVSGRQGGGVPVYLRNAEAAQNLPLTRKGLETSQHLTMK